MIAGYVAFPLPGRTGAAGFHLAAAPLSLTPILDESGAPLLDESGADILDES